MLKIEVKVDGSLKTSLEGIPRALRKVVEDKFAEGMQQIYHEAVGVLSDGKYSATQEVALVIDSSGESLVARIEPISLKAQIQEFGGKGYYDIFPSKGKALRFIGCSGEVVFAKHVLHPPTPAKHYIENTIARELPWLQAKLVAGTADEAIRRYGAYAGARFAAKF